MTNFDFIGRRYIFFGLSGIVIAIGLIGLILNGLTFGIEFEGGTLFDVKWEPPSESTIVDELEDAGLKDEIDSVSQKDNKATIILSSNDETKIGDAEERLKDIGAVDIESTQDGDGAEIKATWKVATIEDVRSALREVGLEDSVVQTVGEDENEIVIRTKHLSTSEQREVTTEIKKTGATDFSIQSVGPTWGQRLTRGTILALILSLGIVLLFVSFRFEFKMGASAVVALTHDVLIAIGLYALVGREVSTSTIAAFLTILGYSMYDTIVVFDRVRENLGSLKKVTYSAMVNTSINQVLRRSINTSMTSVIPVASLLFIGGETLGDFAFALLVGLISGSYSSIFIASPVLAAWKESEPKYRALRKRLEQEN